MKNISKLLCIIKTKIIFVLPSLSC